MKHLKKFNIFESRNEFYFLITQDEFYKSAKNSINFSDYEKDKLKNFFDKYSEKLHLKILLLENEVRVSSLGISIRIFKGSQGTREPSDWFYLLPEFDLNNDYKIKTSDLYYKCDQFEGLEYLLNNKIKVVLDQRTIYED